MYYESKYTNFTASEPPYTNIIYYKNGNKTVVKIHIDNNWNMWGEVLDPFDAVIFPLGPVYRNLTQAECERLLMKDMPKPNRIDVLKKYNMKVMDYATILYSTRLINLISTTWAAWSEDDKVEDYHPRFNEEIMREREKTMLRLDPEPEDDEPPAPYWKPELDELDGCLFDTVNTNSIDLSEYTFSGEDIVLTK
ncbi:MAG: hypothetical protein J6A59_13995 [Lachnospiraceae bacterium]|nr:hypothetical protein [Lachnospiraceae bacterium]